MAASGDESAEGVDATSLQLLFLQQQLMHLLHFSMRSNLESIGGALVLPGRTARGRMAGM